MALVLRAARRRAVWWAPTPNVDEIIDVEFHVNGEIELDPSVFKIDLADLTRTVAEYSASAQLGLRATSDAVDLDHAATTPVQAPGDSFFEFTRNAHHELRFEDAAALRAFLADHILPALHTRLHSVRKSELRAYAKERRDANDPEWVRYTAERGSWP